MYSSAIKSLIPDFTKLKIVKPSKLNLCFIIPRLGTKQERNWNEFGIKEVNKMTPYYRDKNFPEQFFKKTFCFNTF